MHAYTHVAMVADRTWISSLYLFRFSFFLLNACLKFSSENQKRLLTSLCVEKDHVNDYGWWRRQTYMCSGETRTHGRIKFIFTWCVYLQETDDDEYILCASCVCACGPKGHPCHAREGCMTCHVRVVWARIAMARVGEDQYACCCNRKKPVD